MLRKFVFVCLLTVLCASAGTTPNTVSAQNQEEPKRANRRNQDEPKRANRRNQDEPKQANGKNARMANPNASSFFTSTKVGRLPRTQRQLQIKETVDSVLVREQALPTLRKMPGIEKFVQFQGRKAIPLNGYKLHRLVDGSLIIAQDKPIQTQMEGWVGFFDNGYLFVMCYCADDNAKSDNCEFVDSTADSPGRCVGGTCCKTKAYLHWDNGVFEPFPKQ